MSIYDLSYSSNHGEQVELARFRGKPLLIVNTASKCGFTPQYEALQKLHAEYADRGLVVIGFPCDQFGHQEPGADDEIEQFCQLNYGVSFPLSTKVEVNGSNTHAVFKFLKDRTGGLLGSKIKWNFTKFLVHPDGETVERFAPTTDPLELAPKLEQLLAQR